MTTTLSSAGTTTAASLSPPRARPKVPQRSRSRALPIGIALVLLVALAVATWSVARWSRSAAKIAGVDKFVVAPQTFNVVLKEKGELKATKSTDIKCEVEGKSTIISLIEEGTPVKEGDLLVELASNEIEERIRQEELKETNAITAYEAAKTELDIQRDLNASDIRKAELEIRLKELELEKYEKGDWEQRLKDAVIAIDQATILLERRREDYEASKQLIEKKYITQTEYEEHEFNFQKAQWELEKANKALEVLQKYTHVADMEQRKSDVEEARKECERVKKNAEAEETKKLRAVEGEEKELALTQDQLAKLRGQKEKCRIIAPTQGFVVYYAEGGGRWMMNSDNQIKEGAMVIERQILMQLPDTSTMMAVVRVHEAKTDKLVLGQRATVTVEGIPGRTFTGTVTRIAALADSQSGWLNPDLKEYETEITLDPTDATLKPGVTAHTEILVDTVENKLAVPVPAIYTKGGQRFVFREGTGQSYVPVELGAVGSEWAEIRSGLNPGDRIRLAFTDEDKRSVPDPAPVERRGPARMGEKPPAQASATAAPAPAPTAGAAPPAGAQRPQQDRPMRRGPGGGQGRSSSGRSP